ncbi:hypothetical protein D3C87_1786890 [compost metagenome]
MPVSAHDKQIDAFVCKAVFDRCSRRIAAAVLRRQCYVYAVAGKCCGKLGTCKFLFPIAALRRIDHQNFYRRGLLEDRERIEGGTGSLP